MVSVFCFSFAVPAVPQALSYFILMLGVSLSLVGLIFFKYKFSFVLDKFEFWGMLILLVIVLYKFLFFEYFSIFLFFKFFAFYLFFLSFYLSLSYSDSRSELFLFKLLFIMGGGLFVYLLKGGDVLENYPAAFMYLFVMSCFFSKSRFSWAFILLFVVVCLLTGARTILGCSFVVLAFYCIAIFNIKLARFSCLFFLLLVLWFVFYGVYLPANFEFFNELLTYRPTLWFFYLQGLDNIYIGDGGMSFLGEDAASYLSSTLNRGVASVYGEHSLLIHTISNYGIVGLSIFLIILIRSILLGSVITVAMCGGAILLLSMTTIFIGSTNIYGLILMVSVFYNMVSYGKS
ncbi:hypothetical protein Q4583_01070 [Neptunomonas phycophila]|uniref:hypothetical protein n=1 Tax=Neptunomonas phycophila TaxID=1572645 RepID=UPI0026E488BF|nr:hypothetical protein [Neptunomonas phycophila]MDO6782687.1 hypothetical protein [Neptunomonas phycophila]